MKAERKARLFEAAVAVLAAAALCELLLTIAGCGTSDIVKAQQATTAAAQLGLSTGKLVATLNEQREAAIAKHAATDVEAAKAERDKWRASYDGAEKAVKVYGAAIAGMRAAVEVAATSGRLDLGRVLAEIVKAGQLLKGALASFGIEMPGGGLL
jgi:hypothetical protein